MQALNCLVLYWQLNHQTHMQQIQLSSTRLMNRNIFLQSYRGRPKVWYPHFNGLQNPMVGDLIERLEEDNKDFFSFTIPQHKRTLSKNQISILLLCVAPWVFKPMVDTNCLDHKYPVCFDRLSREFSIIKQRKRINVLDQSLYIPCSTH